MQNILSDMMGTTTPNSVLNKLMENFRENGASCISNADNANLDGIMEGIRGATGLQTYDEIIDYVHGQFQVRNFRSEYLALSGFVNVEACRTGRIKGEFYDDVPESFKRWKLNNRCIYIFSNGSEESQRELFRTAQQGDLSVYVSRFFDTEQVGSKKERDSYKRIGEIIQVAPSTIFFLSDLEEELEAADKAGCAVSLVIRPGNKPAEHDNRRKITSFNEI